MRSRYKILNNEGLFFITSTTVEWIPVFTSEKYFQILTESITFCQKNKGLKVMVYVILDNHFHVICKDDKLTDTMRSLKGFTANRIIEQLEADNKTWLLNQLSFYKKKHKTESTYQVWQESFHPKEILTDDILEQKINYIHFNPVKRGLVTEPEHWKYSSAGYYYNGVEGLIKLDSFVE